MLIAGTIFVVILVVFTIYVVFETGYKLGDEDGYIRGCNEQKAYDDVINDIVNKGNMKREE